MANQINIDDLSNDDEIVGVQSPIKSRRYFCNNVRILFHEFFSPGLWRKVVSETIATYFLVFATCGAASISSASDEQRISKLGQSIVGGLIVTVMIYAVGHISGAHMNPAVTIAFATFRHFPWKQVILIWHIRQHVSTNNMLVGLAFYYQLITVGILFYVSVVKINLVSLMNLRK